MVFEGRNKYFGYKDNFSVDMVPLERERNYSSGLTITVHTWHTRVTEDGISKKHKVPLGEKSIIELVGKYGYTLDDLTWESEEAESVKGNPWMLDFHSGRRFNCVYFILAQGTNRVKIGWASDLRARFDMIATSSPFPLVVLDSIPGRKEDERMYHKRFAHLRIHGEWFVLDGELKEFIRELENQIN